VKKDFLKRVVLPYMNVFTLVKNHTDVVFVTQGFLQTVSF
jgi:hypothetical protein